MSFVIYALGMGLILVTLLSRIRSTLWWVRTMDFPRTQTAVLLAVVGLAHVVNFDAKNLFSLGFGIALVASLAYQCLRIFPYTRVARLQVTDTISADEPRSLRLLVSNVLMENRRVSDFLAVVREVDPDVVLVVETDFWWAEQLQVLAAHYPHSILRPQNNYYGMCLYSRLKIGASEVRFLVEDDIPSIRATVILLSGTEVELFCLHPRPPEPRHDTDERDAELLIVGREVAACERPAIVTGDLNDVGWSHTSRLFQRISGLMDPRQGRGMFSTFHAKHPLFRWPLDHVFLSKDFSLIQLRCLRSIGSDHFPILAEVQLEPDISRGQTAPPTDRKDHDEAQGRIMHALSG